MSSYLWYAAGLACVESTIACYQGTCKACGQAATIRFNSDVFNMKEFSLAMRQYTIDKEFELSVEATDRTRYIGYCRIGDCLKHKGWDVVVVSVLNNVHDCTSSDLRRTNTPTAA
jgi:hypothetical protein